MHRALLLLLLFPLVVARADDAPANPIDRYFERVFREKSVTPAARTSDGDFLRRASLDVLGRLPRPKELLEFEKAPDREKKIDELLASDEAAAYFADCWIRILTDETFDEQIPLRVNFSTWHGWLEQAWKEDRPYSEIVAELIGTTGDGIKKPAVNYVLAALDPKEPPYELAGRTARIFLGMNVQCARCHDHPTDKFSQEDFWSFTAFFAGTKAKARQTFDGYGVKLTDDGTVSMKIPDTKTEVSARFVDGRKPEGKGRSELARLVTSSPRFARTIVNRTWAHFMGRGFFPQLDRVGEKCEHEELLEALCEGFTKEKTSLRALARVILSSKVYQLSSEGDPEHYAAMALKPQDPIQLLNTLTWALGLDVFLKTLYDNFLGNKALPEQYRQEAVFRLYLVEYVRKLTQGGGVRLALKLGNGKDLQGLVSVGWGRLKEIMTEKKTAEDRLEAIFLALLARAPTDDEKTRYLDYVEKKTNKDRAWEDVYWVLLNSTELLFNH
ncbi:MAG TPA: DUF1549 domain-containing protein [Planctomycetota bacterium]|nr:DUF1549 domain-containing protein [Planctomycetota bacterium]